MIKRTLAFVAICLFAGLASAGTVSAQEPEGGSIRIAVDTNPEDDVDFRFTTTENLGASSIPNFTLNDDEDEGDDDERTFTGLDNGRYRFSVNTPTGWELTDIDCEGDSDSDIDDDVRGERLTIELDDYEDVDCLFTFEEDEPEPTATPSPTATPQPPAPTPTPQTQTGCFINGQAVMLVGNVTCPAQPTSVPPTPAPVQVVQQVPSVIRPPSTGSAGLLD